LRLLGTVVMGALLARPVAAQTDSLASPVPKIGGLTAAMMASGRIANEPHKRIFYLDKAGEEVSANDDAVCRMEVFFRDSTSGTVRVFYPSGKLYCITPYAHLRSGLRHGIETTWSESGKMMTRTEFVGGLAREVVRYHPNGQVASRLTKGPESLKIESFDSLGRPGFYAMPTAYRSKDGKKVFAPPVWVGEKDRPVRQPRRQPSR
jgi:hypothetical protein